MKRPLLALLIAVAAVVAVVGAAVAADGERARDRAQDRTEIPELLGLTLEELESLRHDEGLSLAQIALRQGVDPELVVDRLMAEWNERIRVREERGALSPEEAERLREQLELRVRDIVNRAGGTGMRGSAIGGGNDDGSAQGAGGERWRDGARAGQDADREPGRTDPAEPRGPGRGAGNDAQERQGSAGGGRGARDGTGPLGMGRP